jgi:hypothetical protein
MFSADVYRQLLNHLRIVDDCALLFDSKRQVVPPVHADGSVTQWRGIAGDSNGDDNADDADALAAALVDGALSLDAVRQLRICNSLSSWSWDGAGGARAAKSGKKPVHDDVDDDEGLAVRMARAAAQGGVRAADDDVDVDLFADLDAGARAHGDGDDGARRHDDGARHDADEQVVQEALENDAFAAAADYDAGGGNYDDDDNNDDDDDNRVQRAPEATLHSALRLSLHGVRGDTDSIAASIGAAAGAAGGDSAHAHATLTTAAGVSLADWC